MMAAMDRDEARPRTREILPEEDTTSLVFRHPAIEQPLPAGDLAVIITSLPPTLALAWRSRSRRHRASSGSSRSRPPGPRHRRLPAPAL